MDSGEDLDLGRNLDLRACMDSGADLDLDIHLVLGAHGFRVILRLGEKLRLRLRGINEFREDLDLGRNKD